jgi:hypothetical protein
MVDNILDAIIGITAEAQSMSELDALEEKLTDID